MVSSWHRGPERFKGGLPGKKKRVEVDKEHAIAQISELMQAELITHIDAGNRLFGLTKNMTLMIEITRDPRIQDLMKERKKLKRKSFI